MLVILGLSSALALGAARTVLDRAAARMAASDLAGLLAEARDRAVVESMRVAAEVDSASGMVTLRAGPDTLLRRDLGRLHGVRVRASRDSVTWSALGLARGLANARFILVRGAAAETLLVSRLGRVRTGAVE